MKLIYRGRYTGADQLPRADLPPSAVRFREPEDTAALNRAAIKWCLLALAAAVVLGAATIPLRGGLELGFGFRVTAGCAASFLTLLPHELLHGLCFGRGAEVHLFVSPKDLMAFVVCTRPVSSGRFILMSLLPNLIFGWLPFLLWCLTPYSGAGSDILLWFSSCCISFGGGDYLNVWNALRQMPRGSVQQISGFHSYWYMPSTNDPHRPV